MKNTPALLAITMVLLGACDSDDQPAGPNQLRAITQALSVTGPTDSVVTVQLVDAQGSPISGETVRFRIAGTTAVVAHLSKMSALTDANGQASVTVTPQANASFQIIAEATGVAPLTIQGTITGMGTIKDCGDLCTSLEGECIPCG